MPNIERRSGVAGDGVFACEDITPGALLLRFTGPVLRYAETTAPATYAVQIGPDRYLGASGDLDDYVNHACAPNAGLVIDGLDVRLVAIAPIAAGEEITFDYSTTFDEDDFEFDCRCGAPTCRGRMRDGKHLPEAIWRRYLALGVLPDYVRAARARLTGDPGAA